MTKIDWKDKIRNSGMGRSAKLSAESLIKDAEEGANRRRVENGVQGTCQSNECASLS